MPSELMGHRSFFAIALGVLAAIQGCASAPPANAAACALPVHVLVEGGDRMNPDESGHPLPTQIRILQLKSLVKLDAAEFDQIWQSMSETLGAELVTAQEVTVFPSTSERVSVELDPLTRFVAGVAIVRSPSGTLWRSVVALPGASARCEAFGEHDAPSPAITFRIDDARVVSSSRLGGASGDDALPRDVTARPGSTLPPSVAR